MHAAQLMENVRCPAQNGSLFFNYKKHFSIILFALVDAKYSFFYADVGTNGRAKDACVFSKSTLEDAKQRSQCAGARRVPRRRRISRAPEFAKTLLEVRCAEPHAARVQLSLVARPTRG